MAGIAGRRVVVFGSGGVLGGAICARFLQEGIAALGAFDLNDPGVADASGTKVRAQAGVDVTDPSAAAAAVDGFVEEFGGVDVLVNNVGIMTTPGRIHNTDPADLLWALTVNAGGVFNGMKAALPVMRRQRSGSIINTASVAATTGWTHTVPYSASKAAILQITRTAALEYASEGIRVNSVSPGTFVSGFHAGMDEQALAGLAERHPLGRLAVPEEVAAAYVYLAGDDASFVTGLDLKVDGGLSAH